MTHFFKRLLLAFLCISFYGFNLFANTIEHETCETYYYPISQTDENESLFETFVEFDIEMINNLLAKGYKPVLVFEENLDNLFKRDFVESTLGIELQGDLFPTSFLAQKVLEQSYAEDERISSLLLNDTPESDQLKTGTMFIEARLSVVGRFVFTAASINLTAGNVATIPEEAIFTQEINLLEKKFSFIFNGTLENQQTVYDVKDFPIDVALSLNIPELTKDILNLIKKELVKEAENFSSCSVLPTETSEADPIDDLLVELTEDAEESERDTETSTEESES